MAIDTIEETRNSGLAVGANTAVPATLVAWRGR